MRLIDSRGDVWRIIIREDYAIARQVYDVSRQMMRVGIMPVSVVVTREEFARYSVLAYGINHPHFKNIAGPVRIDEDGLDRSVSKLWNLQEAALADSNRPATFTERAMAEYREFLRYTETSPDWAPSIEDHPSQRSPSKLHPLVQLDAQLRQQAEDGE